MNERLVTLNRIDQERKALSQFAKRQRVAREVAFLRQLKEAGGYPLGCDDCGTEPSRVTLILSPEGRIERKFRRCDNC